MKNLNLQFNVIYKEEEEGGYTAIVPSLPGCISYGKTIHEAQEMVTDAISGYLVSLKKRGEPIPHSDEANFISMVNLSSKNLNYA